jgi:drug/metabolite transporter (DMT)-like permease
VGAVFLGWLVAGDPVTIQTLIAAGVIVAAVILIISFAPKS